MTTAKIYFQNDHWYVDYIDDNYERLPAVGMFVHLEDARQAALEWCEGRTEHVALVGKGTW
jgi:Uri superfamily endonuclease